MTNCNQQMLCILLDKALKMNDLQNGNAATSVFLKYNMHCSVLNMCIQYIEFNSVVFKDDVNQCTTATVCSLCSNMLERITDRAGKKHNLPLHHVKGMNVEQCFLKARKMCSVWFVQLFVCVGSCQVCEGQQAGFMLLFAVL